MCTLDYGLVWATHLGPTEHVTDWHCPAENAFTMFIQVFHDELLNVHLHRHTHTHTHTVLSTSFLSKHKRLHYKVAQETGPLATLLVRKASKIYKVV